MKVTVGVLTSSIESLKLLGEQKLKGALKFDVKKILSKVNDELKHYEEIRNELIKQFGEQDGDLVKVPKEKELDFYKELAPVLDKEVELPFEKIQVSALPEGDRASLHDSDLSSMDLLKLDWLID